MFANNKLTKVAAAVAFSVGLSSAAMAQETSSSLRGIITGPQGNAAANTTLTIVHEPTGTRRTVSTNDAGTFIAKGLRVGGPYTITIDSDRFQDAKINDVFLSLGEVRRLDQQLEDQSIESIVVTGSQILFNTNANSSYFGQEQIQTVPSLGRDIKDIVRNNPLVVVKPGEDAPMTIAGSSPRVNSISIDGIPLNDDFGLNNNGYPTQRNPFPLDALDQVSVEIAPTHAKSSGFTGGNVDAVFKSGTNDFHGNLFYELMNEDMAGTPKDKGVERPLDFEEKNYGFTLGGPILEDKLFFFGAYEKFESPQQLEWSAGGSGQGSNETTVTVKDVEAVKAIAKSVYGIDNIGNFNTQPQLEDEKYMFKIDWNINDYHRANFVYMFNEGNRTRNMTSSARELRLDTHWYNKSEELKNFSTTLYSDWTDELSTQISLTQKAVKTAQVSLNSGLNLGDITIQNLDVDGDGKRGNLAFGSDQYRHSNSLKNDLTIFKIDATYLLNEHTLDFGMEYKKLEVENQFLPGSKSVITFANLEDFKNRIFSRYSYSNGVGNNPLVAAAQFERNDIALYVNDTWDMNDELTISFGLRYERFMSDDKPKFNQSVKDRTGYDNTFNLDGVGILLPRFGFTYLWNEDVTIRGSFGKYAGGNPNVWISNSYSNDGQSVQSFSARNRDGVQGPANMLNNPFPQAIEAVKTGTRGSTSNFIDPNFDIPSQWTLMLNSEVILDIPEVGDNFAWTTTAIYTKKEDTAEWVNAALLQPGDKKGATKDGSLPFYNTRELEIMLTNAEENGRSYVFSTGLSKEWDNGIRMNASYTYQDITEGNPGGSSTARSNYRYGHFHDHQKTQIGPSPYQTEHRFVLNLGYKTELFEDYATRFNLFMERRSGSPFSYLVDLVNLQGGRFFNQDLIQPSGFGSTYGGNYLPYVPKANDPNVIYQGVTEKQVLDLFERLGLSKYAGGVAEKGSVAEPWVTTMDLYISQEIPGFMDGHKGELFFVVNNLVNLIDSSAGRVYTQRYGTREVIEMDINETTGQYIYGDILDNGFDFKAKQSTYRVKVGVRYKF